MTGRLVASFCFFSLLINAALMSSMDGIVLSSAGLIISLELMLNKTQKKYVLACMLCATTCCLSVLSSLNVYQKMCFVILVVILVQSLCLILALILEENKRVFLYKAILLLSVCYCAIQTSYTPYHFADDRNNTAYWSKSKWGVGVDNNDALNIKTQYSYSLMRKMLGAKHLTNVEVLSNYRDLWIVTPTTPFTPNEITSIRRWVLNGGRLYVVSDHTDLFGHATVLNKLLKAFGIIAERNIVIDRGDSGGAYATLGNLDLHGLSANSFSGRGVVWAWQIGFSERTDYSKKSFFSDLQISDEDMFGVHPIGVFLGFGAGSLTVFGDSTLFSNFALARPSSQYILTKMVNSSRISVFYDSLCILLLFSFFVIITNRPIRVIIVGVQIIYILLVCTKGYSTRNLDFDGWTFNCSGDWGIVENSKGQLNTLFATSYIYSKWFPKWVGKDTRSGHIIANNKLVKVDALQSLTLSRWSYKHMRDRLLASRTSNMDEYIRHLINNSVHSGFWFDEGVGPLRELAYKQFWGTVSNSDAFSLPSILPASSVIGFLKSDHGSEPITLSISEISGYPSWCVIGDYVIAKKLPDGRFIIRSLWQSPEWRFGDIVFKPESDLARETLDINFITL